MTDSEDRIRSLRERFEEWVNNEWPFDHPTLSWTNFKTTDREQFPTAKFKNGSKRELTTEWSAWQAATAHPRPEPNEAELAEGIERDENFIQAVNECDIPFAADIAARTAIERMKP